MQKADKLVADDGGLDAPTYEEIVQILTFLVDVVDVQISEGEDRSLRSLHTSLQASLDAALRLEWAARAIDDDGEILYLD